MSKSSAIIGSGSAQAGDRLQPALDLAASGLVQYLVFDRVGEGSMAKWQARRLADDRAGFDPQVQEIAARFAPFLAQGVHLIGSFGGANIAGAVSAAVDGLRSVGGSGARIGVVWGDDVRDQIIKENVDLPELNCSVAELGESLLSANAYIGAEPITQALEEGAQLVLGGRICDASQGVGAACHALGWPVDYWDGLALSTLVGHLLTGGSAITGGGFADPPYRVVPGLHNLGFAMARLQEDHFILAKLPEAGGMIDRGVIKSRIGYEVHDPASYLTPDVTADFSMASVEQVGPDEVRVSGIVGRPRPETYRVLVGIDRGWVGTGEISFGGPGCLDRARLGEEIVRKRLEPVMAEIEELRFDYFGYSALFGDMYPAGPPADVRLRVSARCKDPEVAQAVGEMGAYLYWGPAGGAAMRAGIERAVGITEAFVHRDKIPLEMEVVTA